MSAEAVTVAPDEHRPVLGIHELCEDFDGDTYRAIYTVQLEIVVRRTPAERGRAPRLVVTGD